jgi:cobalt-zinc-cadmium efflux system outer membrane protein
MYRRREIGDTGVRGIASLASQAKFADRNGCTTAGPSIAPMIERGDSPWAELHHVKLGNMRWALGIFIAAALTSQAAAAPPRRTDSQVTFAQPAAPLPPPPRAMSLQDLETMALTNHPGLAQAAAEVQAARGEWLQAGLPPNLSAGYAGNQMGDLGTAGQQGAYLEQEFVMAGKLKLNRAVAAAEIQAREQRFRATQMRVVNDVRTHYYDVLVAQQSRELAAQLVGIANEGARVAEVLREQLEGNKIDALQAQIEAQNAEIAVANASNRYQASWRKLAAVIGMPFLPPQPLAGDLRGAVPKLDYRAMIDRLYAESPERAAALSETLKARWTLQREIAEPVPNLDVQTLIQQNQATDEANISVQATVPLPLWNRNQGGVRRAQAEVAAAQTNVSRVELDLQQRLAAAFERYSNAAQQVERYERTILPAAQESLRLVTIGWQQGEFDYLTRLTSQRTYFQANLGYLAALGDLRTSVVEIEGLLLKDSLAPH